MTFDLNRLARTALYREVWGRRVPAAVDEAAPVSIWTWRRHVHVHPRRSLTGEPALWVLYPVPGDDPIWVPFGPSDVEAGAARARPTMEAAGIMPGDAVLAVAPPAPWAGNTLPYLFSSADRLAGMSLAHTAGSDPYTPGVEVFPLSPTTVEYKPDLVAFPISRRPGVIAGTASDIAALLRLANVAGITPPRFHLALFVGAQSPAEAVMLADHVAPLQYLPGLFAPIGGHPDQPGVWLPPDIAVGELIRDDEWGRSVGDPSRVPRIGRIEDAVGASGELVISVPNTVLPVVRLRTALRVRVVETDPITGARLEILSHAPARIPETVSAFTPAARRSRT